jgi:L-lactate dehydrogenase complex protein LldF
VYRQIGGHAYGHTYPGPIGILLTAMLKGNESVRELAHASSLCGACKDVCPVRIDIPRMLIELREHLDREKIAPWTERVVFRALRRLLMSPGAFRLSATTGRWLQAPFVRDGRLRGLPFLFAKWTRTRDLPPVASRTFRERWKELR